jgi:hypothetical protein
MVRNVNEEPITVIQYSSTHRYRCYACDWECVSSICMGSVMDGEVLICFLLTILVIKIIK